ncbi:MAG: hypothetical protein HOP11_12450 [Saprospiraceae bacterium]|nr:hypothetical protein [Saprospiraceae bacterium]
MQRLPLIIILFFLLYNNTKGQSPHGIQLKINCSSCHSPESWNFINNLGFNHDSTSFKLSGQHSSLDCRSCHNTLEFDKADPNCISCHADVHQQSVGMDCARCHKSKTWLISNISELHENANFPLVGVHRTVDCNACHTSETQLRFEPLGIECKSCHQKDYDNALSPNHKKNAYSTNCIDCHSQHSSGWKTQNVNHDFFPLVNAHQIDDCKKCHTSDDYSMASANCISCHALDYAATQNPNHNTARLGNDCKSCHTLEPNWKPAKYLEHDAVHFPIYTGTHKAAWQKCNDCHGNGSDYKVFTCTNCHNNPETDQKHTNVGGYSYENSACLACHPTGESNNAFDHSTTQFPLTGAHKAIDCKLCHVNGFKGTPTECQACHQKDYDASIDPSHKKLNLSTDCKSCHTTDPGWSPARFDIHDQFFEIKGMHKTIFNDCKKCHTNSFNNTLDNCLACHQSDYNETKNPNHKTTGFSTDCKQCHNEQGWVPSFFDHDGFYFPIHSGKHKGTWTNCNECHTTPGNFKLFDCLNCHKNPETDNKHTSVPAYRYQNNACLACHPQGDADNPFNHNNTAFPLTGAHRTTDCFECHSGGFKGTSKECSSCHLNDFNASQNPSHTKLNISTDCISCHTTDPGWAPAKFDIHNQFYELKGAHNLVRNDCIKCHSAGNFNNTPNTCFGCHQSDYDLTKNPDHKVVQFPNDCKLCHTENTWSPSTFDHDGMYFPINSGKHKGVWSNCNECHSNSNDFSVVTCITCHKNPETDDKHLNVDGYTYSDPLCFACHPMGDAGMVFDHNSTAFPLTGAHKTADCIECHTNKFKGTSTDCYVCHKTDFEGSLNPSHKKLNLSTDCISCHTTDPGWTPAKFEIHDSYYALTGAHNVIKNNCTVCHLGNFSQSGRDCYSCHQIQFEGSSNPDHKKLDLSKDCSQCHTTNQGWEPARFEIHDQYYELKGAHNAIRNDCIKCHTTGNFNNTPNTCFACHQQDYESTKNPDHKLSQFNTECASCHGESSWVPSTFDHDGMHFPINSGKHKGVWAQCSECHTDPNKFEVFQCIGCHTNPKTNDDHAGVGGYIYQDFACLACHPMGDANMPYDHNLGGFPLTGAHSATDCLDCHKTGFKGTSKECNACHNLDFNNSKNPNHELLNISKECVMCHTTNPGWAPALFPIHDQFWTFTGAHITVKDNCVKCHNGNYNNTPNNCVGCHLNDFNSSINPPHKILNIPTNCEQCHSTDPGWAPATFPIHDQYWAFTGAHIPVKDNCNLCHVGGNYNNTPNTCVGCHLTQYNSSTNPNHKTLNIPNTCNQCHSTDPGWAPATFDIHDNYWILKGVHLQIKNNCNACHNGNYNNTPNTCFGCHSADYNGSNNPPHLSAGFPTTCASCHNETAWIPSSFDHDNMYFPIYSGKHKNEWNTCSQCHTNSNNYNIFTCLPCHPKSDMDPDHNGVMGYSYNSASCYSCHPDGKK